MNIEVLTSLSQAQKVQINQLWNKEYPTTLCHNTIDDFESYLSRLKNPTHLIAIENNQIIGWSFVFTRNESRWFAMIINSKFHKKGLGTQLINKVKENEKYLNGWVIDSNDFRKSNGEIYQSPLGFYKKNGFSIMKSTRLELDWISAVKVFWQR